VGIGPRLAVKAAVNIFWFQSVTSSAHNGGNAVNALKAKAPIILREIISVLIFIIWIA
jgi:hypothetical protein